MQVFVLYTNLREVFVGRQKHNALHCLDKQTRHEVAVFFLTHRSVMCLVFFPKMFYNPTS